MLSVWLLILPPHKIRHSRSQREWNRAPSLEPSSSEPMLKSRLAEDIVRHELSLKDRLIVACGSNRLEAERLIAAQYERFPMIDDDEAARRALALVAGGRRSKD
jgi:hypothetical protein